MPRRSFLAVAPDGDARRALAELLADVEREAAEAGRALRFTKAPNIHLTMHFLGSLDEAREAEVLAQLGETLPAAPFDVALGHLGAFPPAGPPRVFWVAVEQGRDALADIHRQLGRRLTAAGVSIENRPFSPHLTLARVRDGEQHRARRVTERLARLTVAPIRWRVERVTLYHSDLSGPAPRYDAVRDVALRPSPGGQD
ncbi:MAG TPA: RNA 2',3'-cyclic phosphodiesterase [Vicinamibacterales bacterium]|nr:RNA 2',3'-cyclic phosphodiesterase [Vicinamibacterales bacterium]